MLKEVRSTLRTATGKKQSLASLIGLWEILGGLIGTLVVLHLFGSIDDSPLSKLFFGFALGGSVLSAVAGGALLGGLALGRYLSLIVQGLQFTQFSFGWCLYDFVIGPMLQVGFTNQGRLWAIFAVAPRVAFQWNGSSQPFAAFNLFACGAFFYLVAISNEDLARFRSMVAEPTTSPTPHPETTADAVVSMDGDR
jgi:hypothetical protein